MSGEADERAEQQMVPRDPAQWVNATGLPQSGGRQADDWGPLGPVVLDAAKSVQVAPRRPGRSTLLIANTGSNPAFLFRTPASGGAPRRYITLAAGGDFSIDTEAPVYAYSTLGTTLEPLETMWSAPELRANTERALFAREEHMSRTP